MLRKLGKLREPPTRIRTPVNEPTQDCATHYMCFFDEQCTTRDIEAIIARNRYGRKVTESLCEYMRQRSEVEKAYGRALDKLGRFEFPDLKPLMGKALKAYGGFDDAVQDGSSLQMTQVLARLQAETLALAKAQNNLSDRIYLEVLESFKKSFSQQVGTKMRHKYRLFEATEQIEKLQGSLTKLKAKSLCHQRRLIMAEGLLDADPSDPKGQRAVDEAHNAVFNADQGIADIERALADRRKSFTADLCHAASDIYKSEVARITLTYTKLDQLADMVNEHQNATQNFSLSLMAGVKQCNGEYEVRDWARKYVARRHIDPGQIANNSLSLSNPNRMTMTPHPILNGEVPCAEAAKYCTSMKAGRQKDDNEAVVPSDMESEGYSNNFDFC